MELLKSNKNNEKVALNGYNMYTKRKECIRALFGGNA